MSSPRGILTAVLIPLFMLGAAHAADAAGVERQAWGKTKGGETVELYTLTNAKGHKVSIMTLGAIVVSIQVPDKTGALGDVALGFDSLDGYLGPHPFFGAIVGPLRQPHRRRQFTLDGQAYTLAEERRRQHAARRDEGLRQGTSGRRAPVTSTSGPTRRPHATSAPTARGLPRHADRRRSPTRSTKDERAADSTTTRRPTSRQW